YAIAGQWGLRFGAPVGLTPTGLLVFQPFGTDGLRMTVEHPISQPIGPNLTEARAGAYRYDGLGGWHHTATMHGAEEIVRLGNSLSRSIEGEAPAIRFAIG
ncbi:MAG: hypothetical protein ACFCU2_12455, partial [Acidimicrobiia bacterium]